MAMTNRRTFIKQGILGSTLGLLSNSVHANRPTPAEIEGPFHPLVAQKDQDFDLTRVKGQSGRAKGKIITIEGQVLDTRGQPVEDASIDLWQANAAGRYRHPYETSKAPLDPNFQGWAIVPSGKDGRFRFITVYPGAYPASSTWIRPPHVHFKVSKKGYFEITTQMYFPGDELNDSDRLLQRKSKAEQQLMIASKISDKPATYEYNIVLEKV